MSQSYTWGDDVWIDEKRPGFVENIKTNRLGEPLMVLVSTTDGMRTKWYSAWRITRRNPGDITRDQIAYIEAIVGSMASDCTLRNTD